MERPASSMIIRDLRPAKSMAAGLAPLVAR
jgi:hypothetical protein